MNVFAVVVNWNGGDENLACLASLRAQGLPEERIVFVDNASEDGSRERVHERHPGLVRIDNEENLGFGGGANLGAERALALGAEAVLFLNNDAELCPGALDRLVYVAMWWSLSIIPGIVSATLRAAMDKRLTGTARWFGWVPAVGVPAGIFLFAIAGLLVE